MGTASSSPTTATSKTAFTSPGLLPNALYTVSTETPASLAMSATVVAA
jgi:hypothetical protein